MVPQKNLFTQKNNSLKYKKKILEKSYFLLSTKHFEKMIFISFTIEPFFSTIFLIKCIFFKKN